MNLLELSSPQKSIHTFLLPFNFNLSIKTKLIIAFQNYILKYFTIPNIRLKDEARSVEGTYKFGEKVSLPFGDITMLPNMENQRKL